jgi:hypothetical protein
LIFDAGGDKYGLGSAKGFIAGLGAGAMEATFVTTPQVRPHCMLYLLSDSVRTWLGQLFDASWCVALTGDD